MDVSVTLGLITIIGSVSAIAGYLLMRQKFLREFERGRIREIELSQKAYEAVVLKEIGDRIGYSLDGAKIVEIIAGSLGTLLPYSAVSYIILSKKEDKVKFFCNVFETVPTAFVLEVKIKMMAAISEITQEPVVDSQLDESIFGALLDDSLKEKVQSFFNLPVVISGKLVGLICVASTKPGQYSEKNTEVLYRIARQASEAVSRLLEVLDNEKGRLSQAVDSLSDGVLMVDTSYHLEIVNKKLKSLLGIGDRVEIFDIVNALSGQLDLRTKMEEATDKGDAEMQEISVNGKVLQVYASRVVDRKNTKQIGVAVLFHDVTDTRNLEKLRSDFTSVMVHELRAPLTSIRSSVALLAEDKNQSDNENKYLNIIDTTSGTMLDLVNDLLDVAKLESGKIDIIPEDGDLGAVIGEKVESLKPLAQSKGLQIITKIEPGLPKAFFDKIRTKQVLNNLLSNSCKYTERGRITVCAKAESISGGGVDILVSVADTGIGIDPEDIGKLFSRFGQLASGRKAGVSKSSGLGLYIAKGIVEGQGGKIWVESGGAGTGSVFYFTVPIAKQEEKQVSEGEIVFSTKRVAQA